MMRRLVVAVIIILASFAVVPAQQGMGPGPGVKSYSGGAPVDFVNDSFTGADSTVLSSHTGETGATWTQHSSYTTATIMIMNNRAYKDAASGTGMYYASGTAANVNYTVECAETDLASVNVSSACVGWVDTASNSMIGIRRQNATTVEFFKLINATFTSLQTTTVTFTTDLQRVLKLARSGNDVTASLDGVALGAAVTISDTEVSGVGRVGLRMTTAWSASGASAYPVDYIKAYQ